MATTGTVMPAPKYTCYDSNGLPLASGLLEVYEAGTSTPATTYSDGELAVPNPWPVPLDLAGRATVFLAPGFYKFIQRTSLATGNTLVWSQDNVSSVAPFNTDLDLAGVAGEHIYEGAVSYLSVGVGGTIAGRWYLANAALAYASSGANVIAIAPNAIPAGATGAFRLQGRTEIPGATFVVGQAYFVSTVPGGLVTPAPISPNFERQVGIADTTTTLVSATGFASNPFFPGSMTVGGSLTVNGPAGFNNNVTIAGTLTVAGVANFNAPGTFLQNVQAVTQPQVIHVASQFAGFKLGQEFTTGGEIATGAPPNATVLTSVNQALCLGSLGVVRLQLHPSGGLALGGAGDPGATSFSLLGDIVFGGGFHSIRTGTADGADTAALTLSGGGSAAANRGAYIHLFGVDVPANPGQMHLVAGDNASSSAIYFGPGGSLKHTMWPGGGMSIGSTGVDPGANNLSVAGGATITGGVTTNNVATPSVMSGANTGVLRLAGGASADFNNGAHIDLMGNTNGGLGGLNLVAGNAANSIIGFFTGAGVLRWQIVANGTLQAGTAVAGNQFTQVSGAGSVILGGAGSAPDTRLGFYNATGVAGSVTTSGAGAQYNTTSDVRLKTDIGVLTDTAVLRRTVVHQFEWKADGTPGRGVFAQEAIDVAPFAVTRGTDQMDGGFLAQPWAVDYSKYVPDLIVGWQHHERIIAALLARLDTLEANHAAAPGVLEDQERVHPRKKRTPRS